MALTVASPTNPIAMRTSNTSSPEPIQSRIIPALPMDSFATHFATQLVGTTLDMRGQKGADAQEIPDSSAR
jgi:hypothetical protein